MLEQRVGQAHELVLVGAQEPHSVLVGVLDEPADLVVDQRGGLVGDARLGGDELAVLMPGADLDRACELAESMRAEAGELRPEGFAAGEISLSLGVATATGSRAYPLELMARADEQLYRAKITRNAVGAPRRDVSPIPLPR